ncbi:GATOR complex protein NPRL3-like isoform X1 [Pollicipes pollicipes]|uniref:GATOR complex protein NPRL3-like isoform X1 n=2 Tax=Pollicipes pollicipes TaxID=41117 RepID=UPI0018856070|nr:GATOR complex protein NPRL3-like isoform X1 [Pollicipes pollicipes]XP_037082832.1 GATOR complex protein NPRL3-like isoform X1 [Pollicipes pollicipes]XP_037082833.1 GATOR complex protein NPRL3-like isoform X1 [Pollicipes pollicipes]XP_037082834.1 GATOR complex protein NPRL3-like isoform X1 [Pollicipes pollicipes]XP_037082835.1 GATOR complex protein NPRL3-like isoform X1 [Pollicipes pollicipes]
MAELNPLSIILVENGSKGDRLLFRYPYADEPTAQVTKSYRTNPYALDVTEDLFATRTRHSSNISNHRLVGFTNKVLSNLCAVQSRLVGQKFEVKVNDVRFVGHPISIQADHRRTSNEENKSTIHLFHIVFALWAKANHSVVNCYHDLSRRVGIAVYHEEKRCRYITKQAKIMLAVHDDYASQPESSRVESPFSLVLNASHLARELKAVYDGLVQTGTVQLSIGGWIDVNFCLPQKIHKLHLDECTVEPEDIYRCLSLLKPYHTLLLLEDERDLLPSLSPDASPTLRRLVRVANPVRSLQHLAADADLTLRHVFELVSQLVYWAKATIIYPLCEKNVYVISPHAPTNLTSKLTSDFSEEFAGQSLHQVLAEYSLPSTLSQKVTPITAQQQQPTKVQVLVWLLQRRLLMQLHVYVFFTPATRLPSTAPTSRQSTPDSMTTTVNTASDTSSVVDGAVPMSPVPLEHRADLLLSSLTEPEREAVLKVPAAKDVEKLRLFAKLLRYFNGMYHLEEIMYRENLRRSQIHQLLEEFRDVLTTCQRDDEMSFHHG